MIRLITPSEARDLIDDESWANAVIAPATERFVVASDHGVGVGALLGPDAASHPGWYLDRVWIRPESRRQGHGVAIQAAVLAEMAARGVTVAYNVHRLVATAFDTSERFGWVTVVIGAPRRFRYRGVSGPNWHLRRCDLSVIDLDVHIPTGSDYHVGDTKEHP